MKSPITGKEGAVMEARFDSAKLIKQYKDNLSVDVVPWLGKSASIQIFRCPDTHYRFFYPMDMEAGQELYQKLQQHEWYYIPWRWEHNYVKRWIKPGHKVLEIGCGPGEFLKRLKEDRSLELAGLEINPDAIAAARKSGLDVFPETLVVHAGQNAGRYDVVCTFQVMEHIAHVREFLLDQIRCTREGGLIIMAVPNNESFIRRDSDDILNRPPHHMGLWSEDSLRRLAAVFNLQLVEIVKEPLQEYHLEWFTKIMVSRLMLWPLLIKIFLRLGLDKVVFRVVSLFRTRITGHTVIAVFRK